MGIVNRRLLALVKVLAPGALAAALLVVLVPAALAQGVTGGCSATVNGQTPDTLDIKHPLLVAEGDTVTLTGQVPAAAGSGTTVSETRIYVEVVGDVPVATAEGDGPFWGGTVEIPDVLTKLAPGVYRVKGTAEGSGWICTGSAYIKVEGGPITAATGIGAVAAAAGVAAAVGSRRTKETQIFQQGDGVPATPDTKAQLTADLATLGLFLLLVVLLGFVDPSWVVW